MSDLNNEGSNTPAAIRSDKIQHLKQVFEAELKKPRPIHETDFISQRLDSAITYALSSAGKRLRPLLVLSMALANRTHETKSHAVKLAMPLALAVEYIHTYSLIHDDLPAMDNDDYRRGRPTVHRRFDEALAILAGDALLTDAFGLAAHAKHNAARMCSELSKMAGSRGLTAGQAEDLNPENASANVSYWLEINAAKTARLFEACAVVGALSVTSDKQTVERVRTFGHAFGVAFQIKDDIDDNAGVFTRDSLSATKERLREQIVAAREISAGFSHPETLYALLDCTFAG